MENPISKPNSNYQLDSGTISFTLTIPANLNKIVDYYCERKDFNKSNFIRRAVKKYIAQRQADNYEFWEGLYDEIQNSENEIE